MNNEAVKEIIEKASSKEPYDLAKEQLLFALGFVYEENEQLKQQLDTVYESKERIMEQMETNYNRLFDDYNYLKNKINKDDCDIDRNLAIAEEMRKYSVIEWHDVLGGMPTEDGKTYLITTSQNKVVEAELFVDVEDTWFDGFDDVIAWAEMQKPYERESK